METELYSHQVELEKLYNKNQTVTRIKQEFLNEPLYTECLVANSIPIPFGMDLLTHMALHKRAKIDTIVAVLLHHFNDAQLTADMVLICAEVDLVHWVPDLKQLVCAFEITQDVQHEIDKYQFPLPMVIEPREVKSNRDTGMVLSSGSIILKKNHHEDDVCLDHVNRMNKIPMKINHNVATMIKNQWRNLDKPKSGESTEDYKRRVRAFDKYDRVAHEVIDKLIQHGNKFYFTHKYDKRGRSYCQGYHCTTQGTEWNKACLEFYDEELVV